MGSVFYLLFNLNGNKENNEMENSKVQNRLKQLFALQKKVNLKWKLFSLQSDWYKNDYEEAEMLS